MRVTVVHPKELGPSECDLWSRFQQTTPAASSPFLSMTFTRAVGRARPTARVAVIELDGVIEGFLPFELAKPKFAVPIGWPMNDVQGMVGSGASIDPRLVVKLAGLRVWRFDHLLFEQSNFIPYHRSTSQSPVIDLSDGFQSYMEDAKGKSRTISDCRRKRRILERQVGSVSLKWSSSRPEDLRWVIDRKTEQYRRSGWSGLFSDPTALQIAEELAATDNADCSGIVSVLLAGERTVAAHFGIRSPRDLSGWFPVYDPEFHRLSPGLVMWLAIAEEASNQGVSRIDLGGGEQEYKLSLATGSYKLAKGAVFASRAEDQGRKLYRQMRALPTKLRQG